MRRGYYAKPPLKPDDPFTELKIRFPRKLYLKLLAYSKQRQIPMARLMAYAVFNEFELDAPFYFPLETPDEYIEGVYTNEAGVLFRYISKFPHGIGVDILVLLQEEIGLTKPQVLLALRQLMDSDVVTIFRPSVSHFKYAEDYVMVKARGIPSQTMKEERIRQLEGRATTRRAARSAEAKRLRGEDKKGPLDEL